MATQTEIRKLFNKARRILKHPGLDLLIAPTSEPTGALIVITPARVGTAVERNRVRRRIKALFQKEKWNQKGFDSVIIIKKSGVLLSYEQLKDLMYQALRHSIS
jgi:ribonuclease P protein component